MHDPGNLPKVGLGRVLQGRGPVQQIGERLFEDEGMLRLDHWKRRVKGRGLFLPYLHLLPHQKKCCAGSS